jgi:hypothetical protein
MSLTSSKISTERLIGELYSRVGLPPHPSVIWCESPWQLLFLPTLIPTVLASVLESDSSIEAVLTVTTGAKTDHLPLWKPLMRRLAISADIAKTRRTGALLGAAYSPDDAELDGLINEQTSRGAQAMIRRDMFERLRGRPMAYCAYADAVIEQFGRVFANTISRPYLSPGRDRIEDLECSYSTRNYLGRNLEFLFENALFLDIGSACAAVFFKDFCFLLERPHHITFDDQGRLHNGEGSAVQFADGYSVYASSGVLIPQEMIEDPNWLTIVRICDENNQEVKSEMLKRFGFDRFIEESHADKISEDAFGILYKKSLPAEEPMLFVKVVNSTPEPDGTFKNYFLRVPPGIESAKGAVAWTFGLTEDEYCPSIET